MKETTTIQVTKTLAARLKKISEGETYERVIERLITISDLERDIRKNKNSRR